MTSEAVIVTIEDERREGFGADSIRHQLDAVVMPHDAPPTGSGTATRLTRGIAMERQSPRASAVSVPLPVGKLRALLDAVSGARPRVSKPPPVIVTTSDTYRRLSIKVRTLDDEHHVEIFTRGTNRSDETWHLAAGASSLRDPELEPTELVRAVDDLAPYVTAAPR